MAPVRKHNITSKLSAKRPRATKDYMELLEEGLLHINIGNAMDLDTPKTPRDFMNIDLASIGAALLYTGIPPPTRLIRSTNSAALIAPPCALVRSTNSLPSAAGIV